ncbi:DUF2938 domain-containing protein [Halomonas huangheensis]|uniref:DUF2938 domain-containing protein n=1 Tax=Halomonas huangheensis TaxID=1178482 RepID=W1N6E3_9GAMM|nr:DUF2938 domain-containing protein [Halomonas huangheensis]ALM51960.1 hypothetical protein AR456_06470 [Halomonas huangheensis]ERL50500.1 hypothetical protein BJB45_05070 [Halomonas huangheensis]
MLEFLLWSVVIGGCGTAVLDLWNLLLNRTIGLPLPPWHLVGRWFAGLPSGRFVHSHGINDSKPVANELAIGWVMHYAVGILFAIILLAIWGLGWVQAPTFLPALIVGLVTVGAGWFILQPGMGVGIACSGAPNPNAARLNNIVGHVVFAIGMYLAAVVVG